MPKVEEFSTNQWIVVAFLFLLSFGLLVAMNAAKATIRAVPVIDLFLIVPNPLPAESSPMFFAMPIVAFFLVFFLVDWVNRYFNTTHALHPLFPVLFFALSLVAFYVALFWYMANFAALSGQSTVQFDFWPKLQSNAFMLFAWGGVLGWVTRFVSEKIKL